MHIVLNQIMITACMNKYRTAGGLFSLAACGDWLYGAGNERLFILGSFAFKNGSTEGGNRMSAYEKPNMDIAAVEALLESHYGKKVQEVSIAAGGNLSTVFFFKYEDKSYVIRFSELKGAFETERYISELLASQGVPYPRIVALSKAGSISCAISERIEGGMIADLSEEQRVIWSLI